MINLKTKVKSVIFGHSIAALSATIGLGNIAGSCCGDCCWWTGCRFWMWLAALVGAATKFTSISLSLIYRSENRGWRNCCQWWAHVHHQARSWKSFPSPRFLLCCCYNSFIFWGRNMFQSQSVASLLSSNGGIPPWVTGVVFAALTAAVILGGIKRIGSVCGKTSADNGRSLLRGGCHYCSYELRRGPELIKQIFVDAFTGTAAVGGFTGVTIQQVIAQGIRRAVFSNEAGMGTAAMASCCC